METNGVTYRDLQVDKYDLSLSSVRPEGTLDILQELLQTQQIFNLLATREPRGLGFHSRASDI